jgi:hypothetical protein
MIKKVRVVRVLVYEGMPEYVDGTLKNSIDSCSNFGYVKVHAMTLSRNYFTDDEPIIREEDDGQPSLLTEQEDFAQDNIMEREDNYND